MRRRLLIGIAVLQVISLAGVAPAPLLAQTKSRKSPPSNLSTVQKPATVSPPSLSSNSKPASLKKRTRRASSKAAKSATALDQALVSARDAVSKYQLQSALRILDDTAKTHPGSPEVVAEYGMVYFKAEEPDKAVRYFESALAQNPACQRARIGLAAAGMLRRDYKGAETALRNVVKDESPADPTGVAAHSLLARVLLEDNQNKAAAIEADRALAQNPRDIEALYALAFVRASERKPEEVRVLARRALAVDPENPGIRRLLSHYLNGQAGYRFQAPEAARVHYEAGKKLRAEGKLAETATEFEAAIAAAPRYYRALLSLGDIYLSREDYHRAAEVARQAMEVDPEGALPQLQLSYAYQGLQELERISVGGEDFRVRFAVDDSRPIDPAAIAKVFPNYASLTPRQQSIVRYSISPLAAFLPALAQKGARHYLLPLDERITEIPEFQDLAGRTTFDGRYYSSIRGLGGLATVSGIEYLEAAATGGFNTVAHEFAHQVYESAMDERDVKRVRRLYHKAMAAGKTLDYYSATDEFEYFAQGYEAFISQAKRPSAGVTARHTSAELLERDPELYRFFSWLSHRERWSGAGEPAPPPGRF